MMSHGPSNLPLVVGFGLTTYKTNTKQLDRGKD